MQNTRKETISLESLILPALLGENMGKSLTPVYSSFASDADLLNLVRKELAIYCFDNQKNIPTSEDLNTVLSNLLIKTYKENKILAQESNTDALTGLHNRGFFDKTLEHEVLRSQRYDSPLSLALLDMNKFKKINDTYGHLAGDYVLKQFANVMKDTIRSNLDVPSRIGGDEFAIILPETNLRNAGTIISRLNNVINEDNFIYQGQKIDVSASIGIAEMKEGYTSKMLYESADAASYASKKEGHAKVYFIDNVNKPEPVSSLLRVA